MPDPIFIREQRGQKISGDSATRKFLFGGFATADLVLGRIQTFPAPTVGSSETEVPYNWKSLTLQFPPAVNELGAGWWEVEAVYGPRRPEIRSDGPPAPDHGDSSNNTPAGPELSWSLTSATQQITQSIKTRQSKARGSESPRNWRRAIGANSNGEVQGTDKYVGSAKWSLDLTLSAAAVRPSWTRLIEELTGKVNSHRFFGYEPGECLFLGVPNLKNAAQGSTWRASFEFAVQRNKKQLVISDTPGATLILDDVHGWSHVWVSYRNVTRTIPDTNPPQSYTATEVHEAYEEQIYEYRDLRLLGLGNRRTKVGV